MTDVALLVDAENLTGKDLSTAFQRATSEGRVVIRRSYGNQQAIAGLKDQMSEMAFEPIIVLNPIKGKNTADIRIVIDALDLLHTSHVTTFVLATRDSDFAALARRLREQGRRVVGIGDLKTASQHLIQSCDVYHDLNEEPRKKTLKTTQASPPSIPLKVRELLKEAFKVAAGDSDEVVAAHLGGVAQRLDPSFKPKDHGYSGLRKLLEAMPRTFSIEDGEKDVIIRMVD